MQVDSFKFLPRLIAMFYQTATCEPELPIPWTPLPRPVQECTFGLVTSGGLYIPGSEPAFNLEREKEEPSWGDPSFRTIPANVDLNEIRISHLHINQKMVLEDINSLLPIDRMHELVVENQIAGLGENAYSFMGFQGYPPDTVEWRETYGPQVADRFHAEGVHCVLLTPA
jgi:D-proline reductase (dithiol) PrdB